MIFKKKIKYMEWNSYKNKIEMLETFHFQQNTRKNNVKYI